MKSNIFIPKKINVGFQNRNGTYTGKLAYIIYFDAKGKLRKEASWNSWKDSKIPSVIHDNEPTSGFVLNKKAGGYSTGWNHRQTYVRVYDPRGFEFEISIPNLLYILENATSTKGKGLEGEFVYGWDGKDLLLMPVDSPDYKELTSFNEKLHNTEQLKGKDLVIGGTYLTDGNSEVIYMGRFDKWSYMWRREGKSTYENKGKHYFFYSTTGSLVTLKSLTRKIISTISTDCVENYAELFEKLERNTDYSPIDNTKDEYINYTFEEFKSHLDTRSYGGIDVFTECLGELNKKVSVSLERYGNNVGKYELQTRETYIENTYWRGREERTRYKEEHFETLEEIFNLIQPMYKNVYLANGKLHSEGKKNNGYY